MVTGQISKVEDNNTYGIRYDDGDKEFSVPITRIKPLTKGYFSIGMKIEGNWEGRGQWFGATICGINEPTDKVPNISFKLCYDNGDTEGKTLEEYVRVPQTRRI